jgi:exosortase
MIEKALNMKLSEHTPQTLATSPDFTIFKRKLRPLQVVGFVVFCFSPLLLLYFKNLWSRDAYQFFPLALVGVGLLLHRESSDFPRPMVRGSRIVTGLSFTISILLLACATYLWSPWLGAIALLPALVGLVWWQGGRAWALALLPAGLLILTIILPPLKLDEVLTSKLQHLSTLGSSRVLGWLGVEHRMYGNVLEIPGHQLLVEEACSGMKSVLFTAAATFFYFFWRRRQTPVVLVSLLLVWGVVLLGNIARITSGVWLEYRYQINILTGARHEMVGILLLVIYLGFILCLNWVYEKLGMLVMSQRAYKVKPVVESNQSVPIPSWLKFFLFAFSILCLAQFSRLWAKQTNNLPLSRPAVSRLANGKPPNLPNELDGWSRLRSGPPSLHKVEAFGGITSHVWQYRQGRTIATISLDYPFLGYHDVRLCYRGNGWSVVQQKMQASQGASGEEPYLEVRLQKEPSRVAFLWFSTFDESGRFLEKSYARLGLLERFSTQLAEDTTSYRVQMLIGNQRALGEEELAEARVFYEHIREKILSDLLPQFGVRSD